MGDIVYYPSNGNFEARCHRHKAERCTLTKVAGASGAASSSARAPALKRPLGFLAAWLESSCGVDDKASHKTKAFLDHLGSAAQRDFRQRCRAEIVATPGGEALLDEEPNEEGQGVDFEPEIVR